MRCTAALTLATGLISLTDALQLAKRTDSAPRVVGIDIQRREVANPVARDQARRRRKRDSLQASLDNEETLYFVNATLGTPAQSLRLHLDTGSSDLWVNTASSDICSTKSNACAGAGVYNANDSSTYEYVNSVFNISYVDGSGAAGDYVKDTFSFGNTNLTDLQFGVGYTSSSPEGVLGIGYTANEVAVNRARLEAYPNLPQLMVDKGIIQSNAYSLWLNDLDASRGSILFGGVDTEKYHGTLATLPILQEGAQYRELVIAMTGLGSNGNSGSYFSAKRSEDAVPVLLDSGSSLTYLPDSVVESIYSEFNAAYDSERGAAFVDCDQADSDGSLEFTFSSPTISVPLNELVLLAGYSRGQAVCILGISPAGDSTSVLGDTFLRSAYVVYDLANNEISLAQTNYNATGSDVQEITTGTASVPDATGVANAVSAVMGTATGGARNGGVDVSDNAAAPMRTAMPMALIAAAAAVGLLFAL